MRKQAARYCALSLPNWNVGKSSSFGKASNALRTMFTHRVENQKTFGPQSHLVGPCSARWLKSCRNSAFQSTRSTTACPVLGGYPEIMTRAVLDGVLRHSYNRSRQ